MRNIAESIRFSADIVRVITDYVSLKGTGRNLKGLCPFHSEKTPSFSVHGEKQIFHCFGCGVGGDVFKFVMLIEQVTFPESIRIVAEKCGIPIPKVSSGDDRSAKEREALLEIYEQAAEFFSRRLKGSDAAAVKTNSGCQADSTGVRRAVRPRLRPDTGSVQGLESFRRSGGNRTFSKERSRRNLRSIQASPDLPDLERAREGHRFWRARCWRRSAEIPQLTRIATLFEVVCPLRSASG